MLPGQGEPEVPTQDGHLPPSHVTETAWWVSWRRPAGQHVHFTSLSESESHHRAFPIKVTVSVKSLMQTLTLFAWEISEPGGDLCFDFCVCVSLLQYFWIKSRGRGTFSSISPAARREHWV